MQTKAKMKFDKSTKTRQRIFSSAMALMKTVGYQGATIRGICQKANVSPATFYSYYNTKNDLLMEFYQISDHFFQEELPQQFEGQPFLAQLRMYVDEYALLNVNTGLEVMRVLYNPANEYFARERPMQKTLAGVFDHGRQEGVISDHADIHDLVKTVFIMLRGVCYDWCVCNGGYDLQQEIKKQLEYLLCGMLTAVRQTP